MIIDYKVWDKYAEYKRLEKEFCDNINSNKAKIKYAQSVAAYREFSKYYDDCLKNKRAVIKDERSKELKTLNETQINAKIYEEPARMFINLLINKGVIKHQRILYYYKDIDGTEIKVYGITNLLKELYINEGLLRKLIKDAEL